MVENLPTKLQTQMSLANSAVYRSYIILQNKEKTCPGSFPLILKPDEDSTRKNTLQTSAPHQLWRQRGEDSRPPRWWWRAVQASSPAPRAQQCTRGQPNTSQPGELTLECDARPRRPATWEDYRTCRGYVLPAPDADRHLTAFSQSQPCNAVTEQTSLTS